MLENIISSCLKIVHINIWIKKKIELLKKKKEEASGTKCIVFIIVMYTNWWPGGDYLAAFGCKEMNMGR